jgi:hypothetical protein
MLARRITWWSVSRPPPIVIYVSSTKTCSNRESRRHSIESPSRLNATCIGVCSRGTHFINTIDTWCKWNHVILRHFSTWTLGCVKFRYCRHSPQQRNCAVAFSKLILQVEVFRLLDEWCPIRTVIVCNVIIVGQNSLDTDSGRSSWLYRLLIFPITIVCRDHRSRSQLPDQEFRSRQLYYCDFTSRRS